MVYWIVKTSIQQLFKPNMMPSRRLKRMLSPPKRLTKLGKQKGESSEKRERRIKL
jgi:hypothetical protein